jgi:ABC-type polysaccharide/polyol phosphate transport system ATPase subunit
VSQPSIVVEDLYVRFRPYVERKPTLRRTIGRRRSPEEVIALNHVSFTVNRGEAFGVIGRNGAGKSTLLRCVAGTLRPNGGKAVVHGKTSTLLQLGVGFIPELTGRRNVYLGGLAAGLRKHEVDERFDEIVEYAELEDAIDRPMKTYSAGMFFSWMRSSRWETLPSRRRACRR